MRRWLAALALILCSCMPAHYASEDGHPSQDVMQLYALAYATMGAYDQIPRVALVASDGGPLAYVQCMWVGCFIVYNEWYMRILIANYGDEVAIGIFMHELGHLLDFERGYRPDDHTAELSADWQAGCHLARGRFDVEGFARWIGRTKGGKSHPPGNVREAEVRLGYSACSA